MSPLLPLLITAGAITGVLAALFLIARGMVERRREQERRRLFGDEEPSLLAATAFPTPDPGAAGRLDQAFVNLVKQTGTGWTPAQALGVMALCGVLAGGLLHLWRADFLLTIAGLLLGEMIPLGVYLLLRAHYRRRLQEQLPDAFYLLARSLRAGLSLEQALATVAEHGTRPLADEFRRAVEQTELGLAAPVALQAMGRRLGLVDFNVFVTAVTLHRTTGGNLAALLDRVASSTRDRNLYRGYFRAATALGRISGVFICLAVPALFFGYALLQPDIINRFITHPAGLRALTFAGVLEVVGIFWMYSLLRVDY
jgi:tight adherence protein B